MKRFRILNAGFFVWGVMGLAVPVSGELSSLDRSPWLGYHSVFIHRKFQIGLTCRGELKLTPMNERGMPVSSQLTITLQPGVEETFPGGKKTLRLIRPETLESAEPASDDFQKVVLRGKVTGDASFELHVEQDRGTIRVGGRLLEPGTLTRNPVRFAIRARVPTPYPNDKKTGKEAEKDFLRKIRDDRMDIRWTDGKRLKKDFEEEVDAKSVEVNGPGIASVLWETYSYRGRRIEFLAEEGSMFTLWNEGPGPLHKGFSINWVADAAKDPEHRSRLVIEVK